MTEPVDNTPPPQSIIRIEFAELHSTAIEITLANVDPGQIELAGLYLQRHAIKLIADMGRQALQQQSPIQVARTLPEGLHD